MHTYSHWSHVPQLRSKPKGLRYPIERRIGRTVHGHIVQRCGTSLATHNKKPMTLMTFLSKYPLFSVWIVWLKLYKIVKFIHRITSWGMLTGLLAPKVPFWEVTWHHQRYITEAITSVLYPHHDLELRAHACNVGFHMFPAYARSKYESKRTRDVLGLES